MDVTFFENQPFYNDIHLHGGRSKEDYFENIILLNDVLISQDSETCIAAPKQKGQDSLVEPTLIMSEVLAESRATSSKQKYNKQSLDTGNKEELTLMPQHDNSCKEIANKLIDCHRIWKGKVYMRRNKEVVDAQTLQHNHESEPRENLISGTGKPSSSNSNDQDNPSEMNIPIALRKGVRSCTKHPLSKFVSYSNLSSSFVVFTSW